VQSALDILDVLAEFAQHTFNVRVQIEVLACALLALEMQGKPQLQSPRYSRRWILRARRHQSESH